MIEFYNVKKSNYNFHIYHAFFGVFLAAGFLAAGSLAAFSGVFLVVCFFFGVFGF